ncbi:CaiB/BaiF CoA transferase family protein [Afifella marina]|uniref:Itaconate CoA-transferase n=1 Tax=Afifella marina DSM 2698 TaxID=1120955 RepID=A0A1G5P5C7_AFIMA|nr:CaiB/BaiF CoA-transferase family protein [Afifella marina]MBK1625128.1 CoA transferase [Afifella marina DSM 2698]MBK1627032.1 CoA transferase [Afifella marina]MBK5919369.1 CoA transferase [Afifella marina]RAI19593.1 CoA transferase [Afifella marina DSM 2698]SCZ44742.1 itaconate CoA-transferase [Afifella marina DSM 2698]
MTRPLDGVLVVSIEQAIAAPYATRLLADLGARVIKVERPDGGDFAREYDKRARDMSSHFVWTNRSKESLTLDLKRAEGVAILKRLLKKADVFVQNLAPGAAERLGLGEKTLRAENERLITCAISGYGEGGPYGNKKAYDLLIQAEAGFVSVTGSPGQPAKAGISIADIAAGVSAYNTILAALLNRHKTERGDHIEISMLEAMAEWMGYPMYFATDGAPPPPLAGAGHATIFPYGPYPTADGTVIFGLQNDREWAAFCRTVLEREDLAADARFKGNAGRAAHMDEINEAINGVLSRLTTAEAMARLEEANIGTASLNDMAALWAHPQLAARNRWQEIAIPTGTIPALRPISGAAWQPRLDPVPALGEHTRAILDELEITQEEAAALAASGKDE